MAKFWHFLLMRNTPRIAVCKAETEEEAREQLGELGKGAVLKAEFSRASDAFAFTYGWRIFGE